MLPERAGMFGKGVYFADTPLKSVQYATRAFGLGLCGAVGRWCDRRMCDSGRGLRRCVCWRAICRWSSRCSCAAREGGSGDDLDGSGGAGGRGARSGGGGDGGCVARGGCDARGDGVMLPPLMLLCDVELGNRREQRAALDIEPAVHLQRGVLARLLGQRPFDSVQVVPTAGVGAGGGGGGGGGGRGGGVRVPEYVVYRTEQAVVRYVLAVRKVHHAAPRAGPELV